ncbi:hypothetical protein [Streptomyces spiramyceticus]|uniref:hypothetical protein n=1 Tax=Streptomyces spiramyceticus TaxID=299717 RepID=UPI00237BAE49|nr:hypothetical protein [Streptomyces spiramyceticus]
MEDVELDLVAIRERLDHFAGKGLHDAKQPDDFGELAALPQVEMEVFKPKDIGEWRHAVETAIRDATESLRGEQKADGVPTEYPIHTGRRKIVTVTSDRVSEAIALIFNLRHQGGLGKAVERHLKAIEALGIKCGERTFYGSPDVHSPRRDLMEILARRVITLAPEVTDEGRTESLEITISTVANPWGRGASDGRLAIKRVEKVRTIRASKTGNTQVIDDPEMVRFPYPRDPIAYQAFTGNFELRLLERDEFTLPKVVLRCPGAKHGELRRLGYRIEMTEPHGMRDDALMVRPAESHDLITVRVIIPPELEPSGGVFTYYNQREEPPWIDKRSKTRVHSEKSGEYTLVVHKPTPHTFLGFTFDYYPPPRAIQELIERYRNL